MDNIDYMYNELLKLAEDVNYKEDFLPKLKDILGLSIDKDDADMPNMIDTINRLMDSLAKYLLQIRLNVDGVYGDAKSIAEVLKLLSKIKYELMLNVN